MDLKKRMKKRYEYGDRRFSKSLCAQAAKRVNRVLEYFKNSATI